MIQPGNGYTVTSTPNGQTLQIEGLEAGGAAISTPTKLEQFQIVTSGNVLRVVSGTVLWARHNFDGAAGTNLCSEQTFVSAYKRYDGDTVVEGVDASSIMMSQNGKVIVGI